MDFSLIEHPTAQLNNGKGKNPLSAQQFADGLCYATEDPDLESGFMTADFLMRPYKNKPAVSWLLGAAFYTLQAAVEKKCQLVFEKPMEIRTANCQI